YKYNVLLRGIKMRKCAWITDSTSGLSEEFIKEHDIYVIPLNVMVNKVSYKENIELTADEFYEKLSEHGEGAMTSQPAFGEFVNLYEELKEHYDYGIAIHASKMLTGTYESSKVASKQTGFSVEVIDSKMGNYALGKMIKNGLEMEAQGKTYEEIVTKLQSFPDEAEMFLLPESLEQIKRNGRESTHKEMLKNGVEMKAKGKTYEEIVTKLQSFPDEAEMFLLPESLEQMKRSGRVSAPKAMFASLLNINIILGFENGKVVVKDRVRTKK